MKLSINNVELSSAPIPVIITFAVTFVEGGEFRLESHLSYHIPRALQKVIKFFEKNHFKKPAKINLKRIPENLLILVLFYLVNGWVYVNNHTNQKYLIFRATNPDPLYDICKILKLKRKLLYTKLDFLLIVPVSEEILADLLHICFQPSTLAIAPKEEPVIPEGGDDETQGGGPTSPYY